MNENNHTFIPFFRLLHHFSFRSHVWTFSTCASIKVLFFFVSKSSKGIFFVIIAIFKKKLKWAAKYSDLLVISSLPKVDCEVFPTPTVDRMQVFV